MRQLPLGWPGTLHACWPFQRPWSDPLKVSPPHPLRRPAPLLPPPIRTCTFATTRRWVLRAHSHSRGHWRHLARRSCRHPSRPRRGGRGGGMGVGGAGGSGCRKGRIACSRLQRGESPRRGADSRAPTRRPRGAPQRPCSCKKNATAVLPRGPAELAGSGCGEFRKLARTGPKGISRTGRHGRGNSGA